MPVRAWRPVPVRRAACRAAIPSSIPARNDPLRNGRQLSAEAGCLQRPQRPLERRPGAAARLVQAVERGIRRLAGSRVLSGVLPSTAEASSTSRMSSTIWNARPMWVPYSPTASRTSPVAPAMAAPASARREAARRSCGRASHAGRSRRVEWPRLPPREGRGPGRRPCLLSPQRRRRCESPRACGAPARVSAIASGTARLAREQRERVRQQRVAGENRHAFAVNDVRRGPAAPQCVVVHRGEVVVHQRIGVNHFERTRRRERQVPGRVSVLAVPFGDSLRRRESQDGTQPLAAGEDAVAHRLGHHGGRRARLRKEPLERRIDGFAARGEPRVERGGGHRLCRSRQPA